MKHHHHQRRKFYITPGATILHQQQLNAKSKLHWQKILHISGGTRFCLDRKISKCTTTTIIKNKHYQLLMVKDDKTRQQHGERAEQGIFGTAT